MVDRTSDVLPRRALVWSAVVIVGVAALLTAVLWFVGTSGLTGRDLSVARLDAVKIGLSVAAACGGAVALYLAWRRQRSTEQVAADTRHDNEQRRVTDLYTKASEMLGSDQAAVRMAALYALERLAQDHPDQRRPVVSVFCSYLRMPYLDPDERPTPRQLEAGAEPIGERDRRERRQEVEVRYAVQSLLRAHVHRPPTIEGQPVPDYWGDDLNVYLGNATLISPNFEGCRIHPNTRMASVTIMGNASFADAVFTGPTWLRGATFRGDVILDRASFRYRANFRSATFHGNVSFADVEAHEGIDLDNATTRTDKTTTWPPAWQQEPPNGDDGWTKLQKRA
ncbi:pentapeptide repeat-containing protein [Actinosynnema sp. NPDC059797]